MSVPVCFEEIVGLTRNVDPCSDTYNVTASISGLFLDELPGMGLRILSDTDNSTTIMEKYSRALENGILSFKTDLMRELMNYKQPARKRFSGDIGGKGFTSKLGAATYYGQRMYSDIRGGKFILRGVSLILDSTEAVNLEIYDDYDLLYTYILDSESGRPHKTDIAPLELDLNTNYYFLINPVGTPYRNKLTCGCGGFHWCFDPEHTCYKTSRDGWTEWAMVAGVSGDVLADRSDWTICKDANGMILHGNFECNYVDSLCTVESDFANNPVDAGITWAVLYRTAMFMSTYILDTGEVNRYSLLGVEQINESMLNYSTRYGEILTWLAQNLEDDRSDCLCCKSPMGFGKISQRL